MALHDHELLSIWELAYRWCGLDPDTATSDSLTPECRDLLRDLCLALADFRIPRCERNSLWRALRWLRGNVN